MADVTYVLVHEKASGLVGDEFRSPSPWARVSRPRGAVKRGGEDGVVGVVLVFSVRQRSTDGPERTPASSCRGCFTRTGCEKENRGEGQEAAHG